MGTVVSRKRRDGSTGFRAQILMKRDGSIVHRESQTFDRKQAAHAWLEKRENELSKPGALERLRETDPPLSEAIKRYVEESRKSIGKTKAQVLEALKTKFDIAKKPCGEISSQDIVDLAKALNATRKPQTVENYLSHLGAIFEIAGPAWGFKLDTKAIDDGRKVARQLGYTSKSDKRDRRPTLAELDRLMEHFGNVRHKRIGSVPMQKLIAFAIFSTRRESEITNVTWPDLDKDGSRQLVRDMKHPGEKIGNDVWCELAPPALAIIESMPRVADEIFPYNADTISAAFTRACQFLGIEDLHFHDLRHEGVSRLFEMGRTIPLAASVSGHRSWKSLERYTHVRQTGDKYAKWKWLPVVTASEEATQQERIVKRRRKIHSART